MPHNPKEKIKPSLIIDRKGQFPLTRFIDLEDGMRVELIQGLPDSMGATIYEFVRACHSSKPNVLTGPNDSKGTLEEVLSGQALWQALEIMPLTFRIQNVTRSFTHQLVRARIGVTYSQQCTSEQDIRHLDFMVPRCLSYNSLSQDLIHHCLSAKRLYCSMIDQGISRMEARFVLPPNSASFIYMHASLGMISSLYSKRLCTMTQCWDMVIFAQKLKSVVLDAHPELKTAFRDLCAVGKCWYAGAKHNHFSVANHFCPDEVHDNFDWNKESYMHGDKTHEEVSSGEPWTPKFYKGFECISSTDYYDTSQLYFVDRTLEETEAL